jgi:geranylgeranyl reductase family protein
VNRPLESDIAILGAGPGGLSAALAVSVDGGSCIVLERATHPREKVCGDAFGGKAVAVLRHLAPDFLDRLRARPEQIGSRGIRFYSPAGRPMDISVDAVRGGEAPPPGFLARRRDFDALLADLARRSPGVTLVEGFAADRFERTGGWWRIAARAGERSVRARLLIDASGAGSRFSRWVGAAVRGRSGWSVAARTYYEGVSSLDEEGGIELHFLPGLLPGYFWLFPMPGGRANVGVGLPAALAHRRDLIPKRELLRIINGEPAIRERFLRARRIGPVEGGGLPLGTRRRPLSGEGWMRVGDAAGLVDPFTGEGIGNAMLSGGLAGRQAVACLNRDLTDAPSLAAYDAQLYRRIGLELRLSTRLLSLVRIPGLFDLLAGRYARSPLLQETLNGVFGDKKLLARFARPGFYLRLLLGR